jgi:uncharacterized SAM-binding protein YcdF (DUF218 family)
LRRLTVFLIIFLLVILALVADSGSFLVVNDLQRADAIVVLAGETKARPERGLELVAQNCAPRMLLDVPANEVIYNRPLTEIAQQFVQNSGRGQAVSICPIYGLSTKTETQDVSRCLSGSGVHRILLLTSDYHTRRARDIFQHELRGYQVFVTPAHDPQQFGTHWWQHRQWAKINFDECTKLVWWELVDRWR